MEISTIGLDLAKSIFQVHAINEEGEVVVRKALRRSQVLPFFAKLSPCLIGMEACGTSHYWARERPAVVKSRINRPDTRLHPTSRQKIKSSLATREPSTQDIGRYR